VEPVGGVSFREQQRLLERTGEVIRQRRKAGQNYHGAEMRDFAEAEARKIIVRRLMKGGLSKLEMNRLPKSDPRKVKIAEEVRTRTSVPLQFLARELNMGTAMNVSKLTNPR
jgi:hypothetical protein